MKIGDPCPRCKRPVTRAVTEDLRARKKQNAINSLAKARANGTKLGRKKIRDDDLIKNLRAEGFSIREIAFIAKVSTAAVQRGLKAQDNESCTRKDE